MPESPDVDLEAVKQKCYELGAKLGAKGTMDSKIEPIAFGLCQLILLGMWGSEGYNFEEIALEFEKIEGVSSAEVYKLDLAMG